MKKQKIIILSIIIIGLIITFGYIKIKSSKVTYPNMESSSEVCGVGEGCNVEDNRQIGYKVGDHFPNIELTDIDGNTSKLYDLMDGKDKFVVNLSVDWCSDCQREKDKLNKSYAKLEENNIGAAVVYINLSKDDAERSTNINQIEDYLKSEKYNFPTYIDYNDKLLNKINVTSIPVNFILDKNAVIKSHSEEIDMDNLLLDNNTDFRF